MARAGKSKNETNINPSVIKTIVKRNNPNIINIVFIAMPIKTENLTRPSLYSFFQGLKKVFTIRGIEKALKKDLFKEKK